jgi:hypothetical protein
MRGVNPIWDPVPMGHWGASDRGWFGPDTDVAEDGSATVGCNWMVYRFRANLCMRRSERLPGELGVDGQRLRPRSSGEGGARRIRNLRRRSRPRHFDARASRSLQRLAKTLGTPIARSRFLRRRPVPPNRGVAPPLDRRSTSCSAAGRTGRPASGYARTGPESALDSSAPFATHTGCLPLFR